MSKIYDQSAHHTYFQSHKQRAEVSKLLNDILLKPQIQPEVILNNLIKVITIVNGEWEPYSPAYFGSTQPELLFQFLKSEGILKAQPQIRDDIIHILSHGASVVYALINPTNKLSTVENTMVLLNIIVEPHNNDEKENAIVVLKYIMKYTTLKLEDEKIADFLAEKLDEICPSIICYVVEKLSSMSENTATILTNYLMNYIDDHKNSTDDFENEQRSLALEAISFIPKASENHAQVYTLMELYLQSDQLVYNESGLIVAQSVSLSIETIKNYILKFLDSKEYSLLFHTISVLISCSPVWDKDDDCCYIIIDKINDLLNFGSATIQDKAIDLLSFADPTSSRITEEILDTVIEMLATKSNIFETAQILINTVFNIRRGTLECGITMDEFRDKFFENEQEIIEALKNSPDAQEQFQKLVAILQADAEY
ncbi:hypothetical protein TVAG_069230 [Trichomonas vaginalis G3]|uniref:Uncharacterized protein n=1 Tax=Trichomonas vaginalis (strain ATCC PRA-98 / G3) TaxID=412133 RepID=A2EL78_TRIV3|nr:armadillo (ARM) repeat-containing protein family [Trichomonas vaginalis G3]EAY06555.1 hypothetical protein TVAG_069230 [Trichomonas vaginalis G3]KAI5538829.1 armadillo (ARM) repeat-containing protein family [Trichomonas vaginalis G3]|eukprot:XP_001318778.1 hypothetical protein [Trichomonas vaginalis G3]